MEEVAAEASAGDWGILRGRCWEGGGAPPYWPWVQVVRAAGGDFDALAASAGEGMRLAGSESLDPDAARFRLFDRIASFLWDAAGTRPRLVLLDDLHAADEPSLALLKFIATMIAERPIAILGSYRESEPRVLELADSFGDLARLGQRIPLTGLDAGEVAAYITLLVGASPSDAVIARVLEVTAGNPFFLAEVARALLRADESLDDNIAMVPLPQEVRALIRRRISHLSVEAVTTLRAAAVVGRELDVRVLKKMSTLSLERIIDVLGEAVDAGVLSEDPAVSGAYSFDHDLLRETLYDDLSATQRMELHAAAGKALEEVFHADVDPHLTQIARHFMQSAALSGEKRAVEYAVRAADRAARLRAYEDAAAFYERALQLLPPGEDTSDERYEILLRLGDSQWRAGEPASARSTFRKATTAALPGDDFARAALGYAVVDGPTRLGFGGLVLDSTHASTGIALLQEALDRLPPGDGTLRADVLARLATELYTTTQTERRAELSRQAVDMAARLNDPEALAVALHGRHWATLAPDSVLDRLANAKQMLRTAKAAGDDEAAFFARQARLHCYLELCDRSAVDAELDAMERLSERIRQPLYEWHTAGLQVMRLIVDGDFARAERQARGILEVRRGSGDRKSYMYELVQMLCVRWSQGRLDELRGRIRSHSERYRGVPRWRDALFAAEVGDEAAAGAELERHGANAFRDLRRDGLWILHLSALAQACVLVKDRRRAAELYELLLPYSERNAISLSTMPFGPVAMRLGMLAALLERWEEAEAHFRLATERCLVFGSRAVSARVDIEHARMVLARNEPGDRETAQNLLGHARVICEELDMPGILRRASDLQEELAFGTRVPPRMPQPTFRREGQFWTITYQSELARLRDLKGLRYIARLLASPGRELHVLELAGLVGAPRARGASAAASEELSLQSEESPEPVLDEKAKEAYRRRADELAEELAEARSWNDSERAARIEEEMDALTTELEHAFGLGGRARSLPSSTERARVSVTKAIRLALQAISRECPRLGEHLAASIHTGRFCSYAPPGEVPPDWDL
jgi:tetratricopeptide (TPR) repeat protein